MNYWVKHTIIQGEAQKIIAEKKPMQYKIFEQQRRYGGINTDPFQEAVNSMGSELIPWCSRGIQQEITY